MSCVIWSTVLAITTVDTFTVAGNGFAPNAYADYYDADQEVQSFYGSYVDTQIGGNYPQYKSGQGFPPSPHHTPFYEPNRGSAGVNYWPNPSEYHFDPYASGSAPPYYPPTTIHTTTATAPTTPTTSASSTTTTTIQPTTSASTTTMSTTSPSSTTTLPTTSASTTTMSTTSPSSTTTLPTTSASSTTTLPSKFRKYLKLH
ncbi:hypothetical protein Ddc_14367 [Ditylenchus destructor]|nr:hypothetical protein Ddc_14367 [Ditylenchus destructor]